MNSFISVLVLLLNILEYSTKMKIPSNQSNELSNMILEHYQSSNKTNLELFKLWAKFHNRAYNINSELGNKKLKVFSSTGFISELLI